MWILLNVGTNFREIFVFVKLIKYRWNFPLLKWFLVCCLCSGRRNLLLLFFWFLSKHRHYTFAIHCWFAMDFFIFGVYRLSKYGAFSPYSENLKVFSFTRLCLPSIRHCESAHFRACATYKLMNVLAHKLNANVFHLKYLIKHKSALF